MANTQADNESAFACLGQCGRMLEWWRDGQRLCPYCMEESYEREAGLDRSVMHFWDEYVAAVKDGYTAWVLQHGDYKSCRSPLCNKGREGGIWGLGQ